MASTDFGDKIAHDHLELQSTSSADVAGVGKEFVDPHIHIDAETDNRLFWTVNKR